MLDTVPFRLSRNNNITVADVTAGSAVASLPTDHLQTDDIKEIWRSDIGSTFILADIGSSLTLGVTALINCVTDPNVRIRYSTNDSVGLAGDAYDSGFIPTTAVAPFRKLIHFIEPGVLGRYLRIDGIHEAGRWMAGRAWIPGHNVQYGLERTFRDHSRHGLSLGLNEFIGRKARQPGLRFSLAFLTELEVTAEVYELNRIVGSSVDILVCLDINSANIGRDTLWGLLTDTVPPRLVGFNNWNADFTMWDRI